MPEIRSTYGISRIDQPEKKNHGYYVRITHKGKTAQKYFPDKASGGKGKALKLAKEYRNGVVAKLPKGKREAAALRRRRVLKSGIVGVTHVITKSLAGKAYAYWQVAWEADGKRRTTKFSVAKLGNDKALALAIKARRKALRTPLG